MQLFDFIQLVAKKIDLVNFLILRGVLPETINCEKCGNELYIDKETLLFRCRKRYFSSNAKKKRIRKQCDFHKSCKVGSWFSNSNLEIDKICKIVACFLMLRPPRQEFLEEELGVSSHTVVDWFSFCREVCAYWTDKQSEKLGGPGRTVEIDEAKIGHRKYNRGRLVKGNWIFGGFERESKKVFIMPVEDRSEKTLLACIKQWIMPGTTIISDCWKSYNCLNSEGFQHLTVNHTYNFVDPDTGKKF
ncbi:hypothetical protein ALC62_02638 [Cyphomyrmex costatus]|uniref:ISXO2-like transposase domain-containing protein n=1 Tax=Cyphomyrmex costatus TaxID=456900 RepID=A0A151IFW9_9HYME|nr:hypothetical protein ALC62_09189 [Cyphomyrmex costatus]KYN06417.1 hypothetical protein ALC62_02638 [Cyphomyrmex costatus]